MRLPYLNQGGAFSAVTERMGGLCLIDEYRSGSLASGSHLSSLSSPGISQRIRPKDAGKYGSPQGMCVNGGLVIAAGGRLFYKGEDKGAVSPGEKHMAVMGDRVLIFPDKLAFDVKTGKTEPMEISASAKGAVFSDRTISCKGASWPFKEGDGVEISGCVTNDKNNVTVIVRLIEGDTLTFDRSTFEAGTETGEITVRRKIPDFDALCQSGNRLWGCEGSTIYGSKLGDPFNFFVFEGLSTDSYAVTTGNSGGFEACGRYGSHIIFFKEDRAYKLYGTRPANFQLMEAEIPGVRRGCALTLTTDSEDMYYLGRDGVYAYSGGIPGLLSFSLGDIKAQRACGAVHKGIYYLALKQDDKSSVLAYDIFRRMWLPWGDEDISFMAEYGGNIYMMCSDGSLLTLGEDGENEEWEAEFRPFRDAGPRNGSTSAVTINAFPEHGAWVAVDFSTGNEPYRQAAIFTGERRGLMRAALPPNRDESLKIRLRGFGKCPVFSLERTVRGGSGIG